MQNEMMTDIGLLLVSALCLAIGWVASRWARRRRFDYALGLGSTKVEPGETITISATSQASFHPERLIIPSRIAQDFRIIDFKVGRNSQLVSVGALPAAMFSELAEGVCLRTDVVRAGGFVSLTILNQSKEARVFQAGFVGPVVGRWWEIFLASRVARLRRMKDGFEVLVKKISRLGRGR